MRRLRRARRRAHESADRPLGPWARSAELARLEGILFLATEPLSSRKLAELAGLADGTQARTLARRLNQLYDASDSAFRVEELAGGYQLLTRPQYGGFLRRVHGHPVAARLSAPALETLAVIAYRQPVLRADIEAIRGVQCGEVLRQLMERDLVRVVGRAQELGRPFLYGTTRRFLQWFGLRHIDELPRADLLRAGAAHAASVPGRPEAATAARPAPDDPLTGEELDVSMTMRQPTDWDSPQSGGDEFEPRPSQAAPQAMADEDEDFEDEDFDEEEEEDDFEEEEEEEEEFEDDEEFEDEGEDEDEEEEMEEDEGFVDQEWEEVDDEEEDLDEEEDDWDEDDDWEDEEEEEEEEDDDF